MKILITDFDGYNVHNPIDGCQFIACRTLKEAKAFRHLVRLIGFEKTAKFKKRLERK